MYLNQHFLVDVLAGAGIGMIMAWGFFRIFGNYLEKDFSTFNQNN